MDAVIPVVTALVGAVIAGLLRTAPRARSKALLRLLIDEIRVVSPADIRPTYRVLAEVRIPAGLVGEGGLEPPTWAV